MGPRNAPMPLRPPALGGGGERIKSPGEAADPAEREESVHFYLLMPLASCITCSMLGMAVLVRDGSQRASRIGVVVAFCGAWWGLCEVLWTSSSDPEIVSRLISLAAFGWMTIGPAILHLFLELTKHWTSRHRLLIPALYGPSLILSVLDQSTSLIHTDVFPTSWGWSWVVGRLFPVAFAWSAGTVAAGLVVAYGYVHGAASPGERRQTSWMFGGLAVPLLVASFTDGFAPLLGLPVPRLGAASITLLVASVAWTFHRYGYSLLIPGAFATEILASLREGIAVLRLDGRIHSANAGMARLLGTGVRGLEGRRIEEWLEVPLPDPGADGGECECSLVSPGREPVPVSMCTSMLRDKQQNPIGIVFVARDLREITSLRSRLITSGRLASVGQLAAGIAHEINNPLAYVRANLGTLADLIEGLASQLGDARDPKIDGELAEGRDLIEESLDGVDRVASIVRDVKGFSHAGGARDEVIEIAPLLESVLRVAAPQLRYGATVVRRFGETPPVRGSSQQLGQVFLNLLINASQAVGDRGEIRIETRGAGDRAIVEVHDEGCGIPAAQLDRIFDPFFTTKPVGEGTGLGLSISYQIVCAHQGELTVRSTPGRGTCFRVELPAADLSEP